MRIPASRLRTHDSRVAVLLLSVPYVALVYVLVVVLGGRLVPSDDGRLALTFLAAALVALTLEPLQRWISSRRTTSTEERLLRLTAPGPAGEDLGERAEELTRLVAQAFGSTASAQLTAEMGTDLTATWLWPARAQGPDPSATTVRRSINRGDQRLGELVVWADLDHMITPLEERLLDDAAQQVALLLETARMDQTLRRLVEESQLRHRELQESRSRILATAEKEQRRVERDIHDGAQQHLVALVVNLRLLRVLLSRDPNRAETTARTLLGAVGDAVASLEQLSRGLYPSLLHEEGPAAALQRAVTASPVPVIVQAHVRHRWDSPIEQAAYFACLEAVQNAVKHASARRIAISLTESNDGLRFEVSDDGNGFNLADVVAGSGQSNLHDRIAAVGGEVTVISAPGRGTTVTGWLPGGPALPARSEATAEAGLVPERSLR
jgi:signal transduction histidine kinase